MISKIQKSWRQLCDVTITGGFQAGLETTICRRMQGPSQLSTPFYSYSFFTSTLPWTGWVGAPKLSLPPGAGNPRYATGWITLLWLHHNHKMSICYHKNGLVGSHKYVERWFIFMCFVIRIFWRTTWLSTAYLPLCHDGIRGWNHFAFMWIVFTFVQLFPFVWG